MLLSKHFKVGIAAGWRRVACSDDAAARQPSMFIDAGIYMVIEAVAIHSYTLVECVVRASLARAHPHRKVRGYKHLNVTLIGARGHSATSPS